MVPPMAITRLVLRFSRFDTLVILVYPLPWAVVACSGLVFLLSTFSRLLQEDWIAVATALVEIEKVPDISVEIGVSRVQDSFGSP